MNRKLGIGLSTLAFLCGAGLILWLVSIAFSAAQAKAQEFRYLSEALDPMQISASAVTWRASDRTLSRGFSESDQASVARALTQAWRAFAAASETGEAAILTDHFSGVALERAKIAAVQAWTDGTRMVVLEQTAQPEFTHLDGSLLQITADAITVRFSLSEGELSQYELTRDQVTTTLTNETTGWRIHLHERNSADPIVPRPVAEPDLSKLYGINYYPARAPWRKFWSTYDPAITAKDLKLVRSLGGNTIRIFLPVQDFGPNPAGEQNLDHLQDLLQLASDNGVFVIPTLFDLRASYRPALWADDIAYLRRVLPVLSKAPAVVLVDLKNEPDLDRKKHGAGLVDAWLKTMILLSQEIAPKTRFTVGWSKAKAAPDFAEMLDVVSYHEYSDLSSTKDRLTEVRKSVGSKPVLVTEIGASSYSLLLGLPGSIDSQAEDLQNRLAQLEEADGVLIWTLHDFDLADITSVGASPWVRRLQSSYGLTDPNGSPKLAAKVVQDFFERMAPPPVPAHGKSQARGL